MSRRFESVQVTMLPAVHAELKRIALAERYPVSELVRQAIDEWLERRGAKPEPKEAGAAP